MVHLQAVEALNQLLRGRKVEACSVRKFWVTLQGGKATGARDYAVKSKGSIPVEAIGVRLVHGRSAAADASIKEIRRRVRFSTPGIRIHDIVKRGPNGSVSRYLVLYSPSHATVARGGISSARRTLGV